MVPKSNDFVSVRFEPSRSGRIFLKLLGMLPAVYLHDEPPPQTAEIRDVITDWMLSAELRTQQAPRAQVLPKQTFGRSLFTAEAADIITQLLRGAHNTELYGRIRTLMAAGAATDSRAAESRAEVPLRLVTIFASQPLQNRAEPPPPINGGGTEKASLFDDSQTYFASFTSCTPPRRAGAPAACGCEAEPAAGAGPCKITRLT